VENDTDALAIDGWYAGRFDGRDIALASVYPQGVGGALILDGRMYRGINGMPPEPGHLAFEYPGDTRGWEPSASGTPDT